MTGEPASAEMVAPATQGHLKAGLIGAAVMRAGLALLAIPLAPSLYHNHYLALIFLRPTKEVLLGAGFKLRTGDINWVEVYLAVIPLAVFGVWLFYWLGRAYASRLQSGAALPGIVGRVLPSQRIAKLRGVLAEKGTKVVFLGRLAVFPSSLMAAAAGAAGMDAGRFIVADAAGAILSITEVAVVGYVLGEAYERANGWVTAVAAAITLGLLVCVGRWVRRAGQTEA